MNQARRARVRRAPPMVADPATLPLSDRRAAALGLVQGPTELLPVSSSAHTSLVPWLAGWTWHELDPEARKSFEVALHAGTAGALLLGLRREIGAELRRFDRRRGAVVALSFIPPALAGLALERRIEAHTGTPGVTAVGLAGGALALLAADRAPQLRGPGDASAADGLALGLAQAAALVPGVSRNGATLSAARARGFSREQANLLSRTVALPVIVGAVALKGARLRQRGLAPGAARTLAIGAAASFASTLGSTRLIGLVERDRGLWPFAAYRIGLAMLVGARLQRRHPRGRVE